MTPTPVPVILDLDGGVVGLECIGVGWGFALDDELREAGAAAVVQSTSALHETIVRLDAVRTDTLQNLNEVHIIGNV